MKKILFIFVAILMSLATYADAKPTEVTIPDGPVCPANAPCAYSGPVSVYDRSGAYDPMLSGGIKVKVVYSGNNLIGQVISDCSSNIPMGETGYVFEDTSVKGYTHYFTVNGYRLYFRM